MTASNPPAPAGAQVGFLRLDESMARPSRFAAASNTVSFQAAQRGGCQYGTQTIHVRIDGARVGQCGPVGTAFEPCRSAPFFLAAGDHTLARVAVGGGAVDDTGRTDDVRVSAAP